MNNVPTSRKKILSIFLTTVFSFLSLHAFARGGSDGGGDVASDRLNAIERKLNISEDGHYSRMKNILIQFANVLTIFPAKTDAGKQMTWLIQNGLVTDIDESRYVLKTYCADENGVEKSASTQKIDLTKNSQAIHPEICINVRKLALESATDSQIAGLLMHEHARHFGLEDTDKLGVHPIALSITDWYETLSGDKHARFGAGNTLPAFKEIASGLWLDFASIQGNTNTMDGDIRIISDSRFDIHDLTLTFTKISGTCDRIDLLNSEKGERFHSEDDQFLRELAYKWIKNTTLTLDVDKETKSIEAPRGHRRAEADVNLYRIAAYNSQERVFQKALYQLDAYPEAECLVNLKISFKNELIFESKIDLHHNTKVIQYEPPHYPDPQGWKAPNPNDNDFRTRLRNESNRNKLK